MEEIFHPKPAKEVVFQIEEELLGTTVELRSEGEGGKLTINFYSKEELEEILTKLLNSDTAKQNDSQSL